MNQPMLSHHSVAVSRELRLLEQETSLRVLVAEDDGEMRRLLALVLRRDGHFVVEARDGGEILEALAWTLMEPDRQEFDLVICEHSLPGVLGLTVLEGLRARDRATPFILITRNGGVAERGRRLGAFILDRPFDVRAIREAIRESADAVRPAND
jgi:CheY-like chemotaxis protein